MKNRLIIALLSLALLFNTVSAFASVPDSIIVNEAVDINCRIANISEINTVSKKDAGFILDYYVKADDYIAYTIEATVDGEKTNTWETKVEPYKKVSKTYKLNVANGNHDLNVRVLRGIVLEKEFNLRLSVMDKYEKQFMGEYTPVGVCAHFSHYTQNNITDETSLDSFKFMDYAGIKRFRDGFMPNRTEYRQGEYNFFGGNSSWSKNGNSWTNWWLDSAANSNREIYAVYSPPLNSGANSDLPADVTKTSREIRTTKSMQIYADFIAASLEQIDNIKAIEVVNEPNIKNFWTSQEDSDIDYTNLLKETALQIRDEFEDTRIDGFSVTDFSLKWLDSCMEYGAYPYYDAISYHPYVYMHELEDGSNTYVRRLDDMYEAIESYGGWKEFTLTEVGQPVYNGNGLYKNKHIAGERTLKQIVIADSFGCRQIDLYCLDDRATIDERSLDDREDNFGLVERSADGTRYPKDSYMTMSAYNQELAGAIYVGEIDLGDAVYAYLYNKDGNAKLVAWYYDGERGSKNISLDGEKATIKDMYSNVTLTNAGSVELGMAPVFISELSDEWFKTAANDELKKHNARWQTNYAELVPEDIRFKANKLFVESEAKFKETLSADDANAIIQEYFRLGYDILAKGKAGEVSQKDTSSMLYGLYACANAVNNYFISMYDGSDTKISFNLNEAKNLADRCYNNKSRIMQYSDSIYYNIERFSKRAKEVSLMKEKNPIKSGVIKGYDNMAANLFGWMKEFTAFETVLEYGLTIRVPGYDSFCFVDENKKVRIVLNNQSDTDFTGKLKAYDENGELLAQTSSFTLKKDAKTEKPVTIKIGQPKDGKTAFYTFKLENNKGEVIQTQKIKFTTKESISMSVLPVSDEVENVKSVKVKITNNRNEKYPVTAEFSSSDNLTLGVEKMDINLEALETKTIDIPVISMKDTEFHQYSFNYKTSNANGEVVASAEQFLSFTSIIKSKIAYNAKEFTGDISSWADAYPIYINQPNIATKAENWYGANRQGRILSKWDDDNLYIYTEIYDDIHNQQYVGETIWQGDSIQIALDPLNTKTKSYDSDDYELGFALGSRGIDFHSWQGTPVAPANEDWINIIRDEENKVTKYFITISKSNISQLNLAEGAKFGYNVVFNDADVLNRDDFIQFTLGTADAGGKSPAKLESFTLRSEKSTIPEKDNSIIFK